LTETEQNKDAHMTLPTHDRDEKERHEEMNDNTVEPPTTTLLLTPVNHKLYRVAYKLANFFVCLNFTKY